MADNNGWISVNERLPEISDDSVLAYWRTGKGMAAWIWFMLKIFLVT